MESENTGQPIPSVRNTEKGLSISVSDSGATLRCGNESVEIGLDDFQLAAEGTVTPALKEIGARLEIQEEEMVRCARSAVLPNIPVTISEQDKVYGAIRNGDDGSVSWWILSEDEKGNPKPISETTIARFSGSIGPAYLIDGTTRGIRLTLNGTDYGVLGMADFFTLMRQELSIPSMTMQKLKEVINAYVHSCVTEGKAPFFRSSPIYVENGIVKVDYPDIGDIDVTLEALRDFHDNASNPLAFRTVFAWCLLAPLHDELKNAAGVKRIQTPQIFMAGKTQGGKTPLGDFFIGQGYDVKRDLYFFPYQTVRTTFTLMKHLSETNLPALFDDLPGDWFFSHADDLKAYVQFGHFGDRGRSDQTVQEYHGKRSFIGTVNSSIRVDDDLAAGMRVIFLRFSEMNRLRKNLTAWNGLIDRLPYGFLYGLFKTLFEGYPIDTIVKDVQNFQKPADWINYTLGKVNILCRGFGLDEFPLYKDEDTAGDDNAMEVAQAFISEWNRIERNTGNYFDGTADMTVRSMKYRSPIEGDFIVDWEGNRRYIYFTPGAFKSIVSKTNLKLPYKTAADFLNNVAGLEDGVKVENEGKLKAKKIYGVSLKTYCISVPDWEGDENFE